MKAREIVQRAAELVDGARNESYGDPLRNHENIARMWNAYLHSRRWGISTPLSASDVAKMEALLKICRSEVGQFSDDDMIDAAAYMAIAGELQGMES